jgi:hypothetical protein
VASSFPASAATTEGEEYRELKNEEELRAAIGNILKRERTKEIVLYLLKTAPRPAPQQASGTTRAE